jgi:hypothetical protein
MSGREKNMKMNMGPWDRLIRLLLAIIGAVLILTKVLHGTWAIVIGVVAAIMLITAVVGFCPLYVPFRLSTRKKTPEQS